MSRILNTLRTNRMVVLMIVVALVPHVLVLWPDAGFAAMMATYVCFPASMGVLALLHVFLLFNVVTWASPWAWASAIVLTVLWTVSIRRLWRRAGKPGAAAIYLTSFVLFSWLLWAEVMPPT